jgi:hypothetical protein
MNFLDDLKNIGKSALQNLGNTASAYVESGINSVTGADNATRTSNTSPAPDVTYKMGQAIQNIGSAKVGGVSLVLVAALGLAVVLMIRRK